MDVILLCAGFGTRLQPLTRHTPKALLPLGDKPVLDYVAERVAEMPGISGLHLVANARFVSQFYQWHERWRPRLEARRIPFYLHSDGSTDEAKRLGSVGDLAFALQSFQPAGPILVMAGDAVYRFSLRTIAEEFLASGENRVLAIRERSWQVRQRYPVLQLGADDRVERILEAPEQPPSELICPRVYFLQHRALGYVQPYLNADGRPRDSLAAFMDYVAQQEPVRAVRVKTSRGWLDLETRYSYDKARELLGGAAPAEKTKE